MENNNSRGGRGRRGGRHGYRGGRGRGRSWGQDRIRGHGRGGRSSGRFGRGPREIIERKGAIAPYDIPDKILALLRPPAREVDVGMTAFIAPELSGFTGIMKQRYSDFIVHEIDDSDEICELAEVPGYFSTSKPSETLSGEHVEESCDFAPNKPSTNLTDNADVQMKPKVLSGESPRRTILSLLTRMIQPTEKADIQTKPKKLSDTDIILEGMKKMSIVFDHATTCEVTNFLLQALEFERNASAVMQLETTNDLVLYQGKVFYILRSNVASTKEERKKIHQLFREHLGGYVETSVVSEKMRCSKNKFMPLLGTVGAISSTQEPTAGNPDSAVSISKDSDGCEATVESEDTIEKPVNLEYTSEDTNRIIISMISKSKRDKAMKMIRNNQGRGNPRARIPWPDDRPKYLKFALHKVNMDMNSALSIISQSLGVPPNRITFSGTKDKRAITTQWCSVREKPFDHLIYFNNSMQSRRFLSGGAVVGNFSYTNCPIRLGDLKGNRFTITLRDVSLPNSVNEGEKVLDDVINEACACVRDKGFINYFGMQRFGSGGAPTCEVGFAMLRSEWQESVRLIMMPRSSENAEIHEAKYNYLMNKATPQETLNKLPRFVNVERSIMLTLCKTGSENYLSALKSLPRHMQLLYLHSAQSYFFNFAVSHRINTYGVDGPVLGDLVEVKDKNGKSSIKHSDVMDDADESQVLVGSDEDSYDENPTKKAKFDTLSTLQFVPEDYRKKINVHVITEEDLKRKKYTIFDVVLPIPGTSVIYPEHSCGKEFYAKLLEEKSLNIDSLKCIEHHDYSLYGTYRHIIQMPKDLFWEIKTYQDEKIPLVMSDLERLEEKIRNVNAEYSFADSSIVAAEQNSSMIVNADNDSVIVDADEGDSMMVNIDVEDSNNTTIVNVEESTIENAEESESVILKIDETEAIEDGNMAVEEDVKVERKALCISFSLPPSTYATSFLREITKLDMSTSNQKELNTQSKKDDETELNDDIS